MIGLGLYKILFMTEILVAEAMFTIRLPRRSHFVWRCIGALAVCYSAAVLYPVGSNIALTSWYSSLMFLLLFGITFAAIMFVFRVGPDRVFFCAVTAYTVQHLAYGFISVLFSAVGNIDISSMYIQTGFDFSTFDEGSVIVILAYFSIFLLVYWSSYLLLGPWLKNANDLRLKGKFLLLVTLMFIIDIVLNAVVVYDTRQKVYEYVVAIYNVVCCFLIFYIQYTMIKTKDMNIEIERMQEALRQAEKQYALQKENINLINIKCHDLKHQIRQFATKGAIDTQYIAEIEDIINIYDSTVKTGNEVLDVILTEKSLMCHNKKIKLNCMVDGSGLNRVKQGDLYALFGNILDNSIEAVTQVAEEDKRVIGLNVHTIKKFVSIKIDNYFVGKVNFSEDGLPETTKGNADYHGYGMRSIQAIIDKYGGTMNIEVKDGEVFVLSIVLPL